MRKSPRRKATVEMDPRWAKHFQHVPAQLRAPRPEATGPDREPTSV